MKITQAIVGTERCHVTMYSSEFETNQYKTNALAQGAKGDGILSNITRQLKQAVDKRLRTQGAQDASFFPV